MTVTSETNGTEMTFKVAGRLDTITAQAFEEKLREITEEVQSVVFDLKELEYISSAGLRIILKIQKKMSALGGLKIINVCDDVMDVFDITGFSDILTIE